MQEQAIVQEIPSDVEQIQVIVRTRPERLVDARGTAGGAGACGMPAL